jgi:hypothetical protein
MTTVPRTRLRLEKLYVHKKTGGTYFTKQWAQNKTDNGWMVLYVRVNVEHVHDANPGYRLQEAQQLYCRTLENFEASFELAEIVIKTKKGALHESRRH